MDYPRCGYVLEPFDKECPRCQRAEEAGQTASPLQAGAPAAPLVLCPACNRSVSSLAAACPQCGHSMGIAGDLPYVAPGYELTDDHRPATPTRDEPWADRYCCTPGHQMCTWSSAVALSLLLGIAAFIIGLIGVASGKRIKTRTWATRYLVGGLVMPVVFTCGSFAALPLMVGSAVTREGERSRDATEAAQCATLQNAVDLYKNVCGEYLPNLEALTADSGPCGYDPPYSRSIPESPPGGPYALDSVTGVVTIEKP